MASAADKVEIVRVPIISTLDVSLTRAKITQGDDVDCVLLYCKEQSYTSVLSLEKTLHGIGVYPVPENTVLRDQGRLRTVLMFLKASRQVEQLLEAFKGDMAGSTMGLEDSVKEAGAFEDDSEDDDDLLTSNRDSRPTLPYPSFHKRSKRSERTRKRERKGPQNLITCHVTRLGVSFIRSRPSICRRKVRSDQCLEVSIMSRAIAVPYISYISYPSIHPTNQPSIR